MAVTKEQVQARAKELKITLSDAEVDTFVKLDILPAKEGAGPSPDDDDDADDKGGKGAETRIKQLVEQRKVARDEAKALSERVKVLEAAEGDKKRAESEKKGEYDKLIAEATKKAADADAAIGKAKTVVQVKAIEGAVTAALMAAGVPKDRLSKALKLFDISKVVFSWTNENDLAFEVEDPTALVEAFKTENEFMFDAGDGNGGAPSGPLQPNARPQQKPDEKAAEELRRKYPSLQR
jgi:hypothetical protein